MFLVLFGAIFSDRSQPKVELVQIGDVALFDDLPAPARAEFDAAFDVRQAEEPRRGARGGALGRG